MEMIEAVQLVTLFLTVLAIAALVLALIVRGDVIRHERILRERGYDIDNLNHRINELRREMFDPTAPPHPGD